MCDRFVLETPLKVTADKLNAQLARKLLTVPNYNICPSENVSVVVSNFEQRRLGQMQWGFVPHWYKTLRMGHYYLTLYRKHLSKSQHFATHVLRGDA